MWRFLLFGALAGSKRFQRLFFFWVLLMGFFFYIFVHDAFDGSSEMHNQRPSPAPASLHR